MKKRNMKRMAAIALTGALAVAMAVPAMADDAADTSATGKTNEIAIMKTMYFVNKGANVYEPNIAFQYTVTAPTKEQLKGVTVKDHEGKEAKVLPGDLAAFDSTSKILNYSSDHKIVENVDANGVAVAKRNKFTFNTSVFVDDETKVVTPGVYRYLITESTVGGVTKAAAGVEEQNGYNKQLILDVYVTADGTATPIFVEPEKNDPTPDNPFDDPVDNSDDPNGDNNKDDKDDKEGKTDGFGGDSGIDEDEWGTEDPVDKKDGDPASDPLNNDGETTSQETAKVNVDITSDDLKDESKDIYTTYNFTVKKTVTGTMGNKTQLFDFDGTFANTISNAKYSVSVADAAATAAMVKDNLATASIKHGQTIEVTGLPSQLDKRVTVAVNEKNTATETYTTSATFNNTEVLVAGEVKSGEKAVISAQELTADQDNELNVTNKLDAISPTGVVLRFAPYIAIIGAALALLGFTRRRRA